MLAEAKELSPVVTTIGQVLGMAIVVAGGAAFNHWKGGRRDKGAAEKEQRREESLDRRLTTLVEKVDERIDKRITRFQERVDDRLDKLDAKVAEVRAFCVGPDGENGFRSQIRNLQTDVEDLKQQRPRLDPADVGSLDRRAAS